MFNKLKAMLGGDVGGDEDGDEDDDDIAEVEVHAEMRLPDPEPSPANDAESSLLAGELRAAQKIQMSLVPKTFPPIAGCLPFDLYAILEPAREIGGDFYDFWLNGRENLVLVIGDVSGKGIPAALFMAVCRTYLRAFSRSVAEPARLLEHLNNEVSRHNESCMFVTLLCATVHIPSGRVVYANAGHNPPFLRRRNGEVTMLEMADDMPVGFMAGTAYSSREIQLAIGDSLFLYTDGVPEAFNEDGDMLGDAETLALFRNSATTGGCRTTVGQLRAELSEFVDGAVQSDDITMMMYGQLDQRVAMDLSSGRDYSDALDGDVFSLSDLNAALPRPGEAKFDMGLSLSDLSDGG